MLFSRIALSLACAVLAAGAAACTGSTTRTSTGSSPTSPSQGGTTTEVLSGTVPAPVNGVPQSAFNSFVVGQAGTVAVTLKSTTETVPIGPPVTTVTMGLAIGNSGPGGCAPLQNASATAQPGDTPQLSLAVSAGTYCVQVSDVSNQVGPVAYTVAVAHP